MGRQTAPGAGDSGTPEALSEAREEDERTIAVLPFVNMSADADQEYFSDGMTEELLNTLAKIRELKVMARTSAFGFKGENPDVRDVGDSLGVEYLVEGSVRKAGSQLRITAQLIDTDDGSHLWTKQYDRQLDDVFAIQTEIARSIAEALRVPLGLEESERLVTPTEDLEAFDLYLAGRERIRNRGEDVLEAVDLFEAAIARDSSWAPAWAGLAESRALVPYYAPSPRDSALWARSLDAAERAARRALNLDPDNASALVALGNVYRDRREWDEAEATYLRALKVDPENVEAYQQYSELLLGIGRADDAYAASHRALALDRAPIRLNEAGRAARENLRCDEAVALLSEGIRKDSDEHVPALRSNLAIVDLVCAHWKEVRERKLENLAELGRDAIEGIRERWDKRHLREIASGQQWADELREMWPTPAAPTPEIIEFGFWSRFEAILWGQSDMPEKALPILEEHLDRGVDYGTNGWLFSPALDSLRDDPVFQEIMADQTLEGRRPQRLGTDE
ncbi:MAG: tetratricopeptide repeat protein [Halobacteriales archaeon]|nr:tetratricopeptide repeat protein [Halobacteriales archaeon]